jgi:hypothetical protein
MLMPLFTVLYRYIHFTCIIAINTFCLLYVIDNNNNKCYRLTIVGQVDMLKLLYMSKICNKNSEKTSVILLSHCCFETGDLLSSLLERWSVVIPSRQVICCHHIETGYLLSSHWKLWSVVNSIRQVICCHPIERCELLLSLCNRGSVVIPLRHDLLSSLLDRWSDVIALRKVSCYHPY